MRLGEELDLPDPPEAQLHVPVGPKGPRGGEVDPVLHPLDLLDRGEVEVLAVDEGDDGPEELLPEGKVPRHGARLDERRALPRLPPRLVVDLGGAQRVGELPARPLGAQPKVHPEDEPVLRRFRNDPGDRLAQPDEIFVQRNGTRGPFGTPLVRFVEVDDVDVGAEVQLERPQLPHPHHDESRRASRPVGKDRDRRAEARVERPAGEADRPFERRRRQPGKILRDLGKGGDAGEVARRDPGDLPVLHPAQVALELLLRRAPVRGRQGLPPQRTRPGTPKHPVLEEEELEDLRAPGDLLRDELRAPQQRPDQREKVLAGERPLQEGAGKGIEPPGQVEKEKVRVGRGGGGAADPIPSGMLPRKALQELGEQRQGAGRVPDADLPEAIGGGAVSPGGGRRVQRKSFRRARARGGL